jgi:hypothetical protein
MVRGDGGLVRRKVNEINLRYSYYAPTECYW